MPYKPLPAHPSLDHLKYQAKDLQNAQRAGNPSALQRIREFHPRFRGASDDVIQAAKFTLSDAQLTIAREYCFASWAKLKAHVTSGEPSQDDVPFQDRIPDPVFRRAVELVDAGDADGLREFLRQHPQVVRQHVFFSISNYFGRPSLLQFVPENPIRHEKMPANAVEIAQIILDAGGKDDIDDVNMTLGLVTSGRMPRECGLQVPLVDLLIDYGAKIEGMGAALAHGEFEAVEAMIRRGGEVTFPVAAATGRTEDARRLLPRATPEERHFGLALSAQFGRLEIVKMLLDAGENPSRFNPPGAHSHSTPLHQAALAGYLDVVKFLVERGADRTVKDILFEATPLGWAVYEGQTEVAEYLKSL